MKLLIKVPLPPRLSRGPTALGHVHPPGASRPCGTERQAIVEGQEATRAWEPERALPQPARASDFELAGDEQTIVGASNLSDPRVFRSQPPGATVPEAQVEWPADEEPDEETVVEFACSLADLNRDDARPAMAPMWAKKKRDYTSRSALTLRRKSPPWRSSRQQRGERPI